MVFVDEPLLRPYLYNFALFLYYYLPTIIYIYSRCILLCRASRVFYGHLRLYILPILYAHEL